MPTKERLADRNVTTTELALILGITGRRVQQLTQDGVLTTVSRGKFVLSDAVQAYIGSISRGGLTKEEAEEAKKIERSLFRRMRVFYRKLCEILEHGYRKVRYVNQSDGDFSVFHRVATPDDDGVVFKHLTAT